MYEAYFGLKRNPFGMTPDPSQLFPTAQHQEALAGIVYGILHQKGFVVLIGDAGTGKTTLLHTVLKYLPAGRAHFSLITNTTLEPDEFLEMTLLDFGLAHLPASKSGRLACLADFLLRANAAGQVCVLVVDEAHKLSVSVMEEIRLLTNLETDQKKLLQILLVGQGELNGILERQDLRQLKQRIAIRLSLSPLAAHEVEQYARFRWQRAGATRPLPFSGEALALVAAYSGGIPRLINVVCDNALLLAFADTVPTVEAATVREVGRNLKLEPPSQPGPDPSTNGRAPASFEDLRIPAPLDEVGKRGALPTLERYQPVDTRSWPWRLIGKSR